MENYKIEKEYKMMLKEAEFELLLSKLPPHEVRIQSNFYYTASNNMGMRIRYLNDKYYKMDDGLIPIINKKRLVS